MLRFTRSIHSSRALLQSALETDSAVLTAKESVESYLNYFKTPKDLRPFVYRKRNASELLSRDLWDEVAKKRIVPQEPPKVPSVSALSKIFSSIQDKEELHQYKLKLVDLAKKPKYTKPAHINAFLHKSAELNKFGHALTFLYSQKTLNPILTADNLNLILFYQYINPAKSLYNSQIKIAVARKKLPKRSNEITDLLEASIYLKNKNPVPAELSLKISKAENTSIIPKALELTNSTGKSQALLNEYKEEYLLLKPVAIEFTQDALSSAPIVQSALQFVESYEKLEQKLNKDSIYVSVTEKSQFGKYPEKATETESEEQQQEQPQEDK